ncbi:MAG: Smr/MutS family protein [Alphaproteobacteria bacterium]
MPSEPPSRKRPLTAEEAELWHHAMRHAKKLRRRERESDKADEAAKKALKASSNAQADQKPVASDVPSRARIRPSRPAAAPLSSAANTPPPLAQFDERQRRKLSRNVAPIEARLDLHGMRQLEAHGALRNFLRSCAARGLRHVLVITGKGAPEGHSRDHLHGDERGVLRRVVPHWMKESGLREIVVSFTTAHARHGGQGALYVHLRKSAPLG